MSDKSGRHETDEALEDERRMTDERERAGDDALDEWRVEHEGDAITNGTVELTSPRHLLAVVNWVMIVLVVLWMAIITQQVILSTSRISDINTRQIATVQDQNDTQLCAQHDITVAVISVARKLGLPTDDIAVPDITGLECDARAAP
jgi:hypothetical protein